jgi:hypothetical protein
MQPATTVPLLLTVNMGTSGSRTTRLFRTPGLAEPRQWLTWLALLPALVGLVLWPRWQPLSRRAALGLLVLGLCCSVALTSCPGDEQQLDFTVAMPPNGVVAQGTTSGPLTGPTTQLVGARVTVAP